MALSTAQPMKLLSLCVDFHGYSVKDSTDSQLSFVLVAGLSGLHSHSDFFSPLRPQWSSHIFSLIRLFFSISDGDVDSRSKDVESPAALHEEKAVGRSEAAVETSGPV